ncbi:MAG: M48 family metallopeptidase [Phycisphaerales bacterium]
MQIVLILLVALVYVADEAASWAPWPAAESWSAGMRIGVTIGAMAGLAVAVSGALVACRRRLERRGSWRAAMFAERAVALGVWTLLGLHAFGVIALGFVGAIRAVTGDLILVDEVLALLPALVTIVLWWSGQYPIHRRVREAALMRNLDQGKPVYPIWTRGQYLLTQARLHFVLILAPVLVIMGWSEVVERYWPWSTLGPLEEGAVEFAALVVGAGVVFLVAPVMIRMLWDTAPLAPGDLRDRLERLLVAQGVRVRRILVWNTYGMMVNGAVVGAIGPLRYVLLSDALLDGLDDDQVEAVTAHEVAHIRRRHLPWLALCIIAIFGVTGAAVDAGLSWWYRDLPAPPESMGWADGVAGLALIGISLVAFGWISRRFERQADTFATQALSGMTRRTREPVTISAEAVETMSRALGIVCDLNHASREAKSWRHGSIAWRQRYLRSLVGARADRVSIDRLVRWIKRGALAALFGLIAWSWWW